MTALKSDVESFSLVASPRLRLNCYHRCSIFPDSDDKKRQGANGGERRRQIKRNARVADVAAGSYTNGGRNSRQNVRRLDALFSSSFCHSRFFKHPLYLHFLPSFLPSLFTFSSLLSIHFPLHRKSKRI